MSVASSVPPAAVLAYARSLVGPLLAEPACQLVGLYLHGSAVLGGFVRSGSDVDILGVLAGPLDRAGQERVGAALAAVADPAPGTGLELSLITAATAADLGECRFEVHVATGADRKVVAGADRPGDPDLILHAEVCRRHGYPVHGPSPGAVFGPVPRRRLLAAVHQEVDWGLDHSSLAYAVLNACRAERFAVTGELVGKVAAGQWALARWPDQPVLAQALHQQRTGRRVEVTEDAARFVAGVRDRLRSGASEST